MSRPSERPGSAGRKSWKQQGSTAGTGRAQRSNKSLGRWLLTFVLLALVAGFTYWVWPDPRGDRHLVATSIWSADRLAVPPVSYAREDIDQLLKTPDVIAFDATGEGQDEAGLGRLANDVARKARHPDDTVIFYIAAHGIADESGAFLICSDFTRSVNQGRYSLEKLLHQVAKSPAGLKLIVLDVGRLNYDPRLGIFGNDFLSAAATQIKEIADPNLWVLVAAGDAESAILSHPDRRSVFGRAVADGLAGEATRTESGLGDNYVDLRELADFVTRECQKWFGAELPDYQAPVLLQGGTGVVDPSSIPNDKPLRLLFIKELSTEKEAEEKSPSGKVEKKSEKPADSDSDLKSALWPFRPSFLGLTQAPPKAGDNDDSKVDKKAETSTGEKATDGEKKAAAAPAETKPGNDKGSPEKSGVEKGKSESDAAPAKDSVKKEDPPSPKKDAVPLAPEQQVRVELQRLWELRDHLRDRRAVNGMSPVDFAPHIWREAEAWILYYERRARAGRIVNSAEPGDARDKQEVDLRLRDMRQLSGELTRLRDAMDGSSTPANRDQKSVGDRLLGAWQRYVQERGAKDRQFDEEAEELRREGRLAARLLADQIYHSVYFVRWFGHSDLTLSDSSRRQAAIGEYLDDLAVASAELRELERNSLPVNEQSRLRSFISHEKKLAARQKELDAELTAIERGVLEKSDNHVSQLRADQLLATPWLSASRRMQLFYELTKKRPAVSPSTMTSSNLGPSGISSSRRLLTSRRHNLQLEAKLIQLAESDSAKKISATSQDAGPGEDEQTQAKRLRDGVREVVSFYNAVPRSLTGKFSLFLVDPRDAATVDADAFAFPVFDFQLERSSELQIIPLAKLIEVQPDQTTTVSVTVRATSRTLLDSQVSLNNSEGLLQFEPATAELLPSERGWHAKTIHWRVKAKPAAISEKKNRTSIAVTAVTPEGTKQSTSIEVDLPQPNRIDVVYYRVGSAAAPAPSTGDLRLALFSNRRTKFQFALVNQHDKPKLVNVSLYAVTPRPNSTVPVGQFDPSFRTTIYDARSRVFLNAKLIAKSEKPVELPAADPSSLVKAPVTFDFANPNPPAAPAATTPTAAPPPPAAPAAPEAIHGLILELTDAKGTNQLWPVKWIELEPLAPRDFLNIEVGYDQRRQQILARLQPKNFNMGVPDLPAGDPIVVTWDPSEAKLPPEGTRNLEGQIDGAVPQPEAVLAADVPADDLDRMVKIGVDGYPRAFRYKVNCRLDSTQEDFIQSKEDLERETTSIKIESVSVPSQNKVYHFLRDYPIPPQTDEKAPKVDHVFLDKGQMALFRAPAETIIVNLQADAPLDAFRVANDRIQVTLRQRNSTQPITRTVRADREFKVFYIASGPRGLLELECRVGDLAVPLPAGRLENAEPVIDADIRFGAEEDSDAVIVQLDGDTPRIDGLSVPRMLLKDANVPVRLTVSDYEGIDRVVYGFSKDGSMKLAEADSKTVAIKSPRLDQNQRHLLDFGLDLKDQPTGRKLLLLVKVVDHVGHESPLKGWDIQINDPKAMPEKGEIRGAIRYGPAKVNGSRFKMTIEGGDLGPTPVAIQPDGSFVIPDLPIAEYTLKVLEGQFSGKSLAPKEQKGVKPADPEKPKEIVIDMSS